MAALRPATTSTKWLARLLTDMIGLLWSTVDGKLIAREGRQESVARGGVAGLLKNFSASAMLRMLPASMNQTRSATSRANAISWVTHIMVMPSLGQAAHDREDLADHFGVERAGRFVEQHRRAAPSRAHARLRRAAAGRRKAGPDRIAPCWRGRRDRAAAWPCRARRRALDAAEPYWRQHDVLQHRHMRKQVEALEHETRCGFGSG